MSYAVEYLPGAALVAVLALLGVPGLAGLVLIVLILIVLGAVATLVALTATIFAAAYRRVRSGRHRKGDDSRAGQRTGFDQQPSESEAPADTLDAPSQYAAAVTAMWQHPSQLQAALGVERSGQGK